MTDPMPCSVALAEDITHRLGQLTEYLAQAPPRQAAQILGKVLDSDEGILGQVTALLATGSYFAQHHARIGTFPPEVWLALGRASNKLHDIGLDLDEHLADIQRLAASATAANAAAPKPVASDMVVRRRR
ncbi:hypothetical protein ACFV1B_14855 [Streptomyces sp. NPDC059637]|uniref:hypothetical protein n=1 Tax=Streptomyces sp. NPDC059637 TaxID=3347752 RepID=UPI003697B326